MNKKANQGFSIVEVIIAIAIFAIVALPLFSAFAQSAKTNAKAREIMNATNLAQNIIEDIKADGALVYTGLPEIMAGGYSNVPVSDALTMGGKQYYAKVTISPSIEPINTELVFPFQGINPAFDAVYQNSNDLKKEISQAYTEEYTGNTEDYMINFNDRFYLSSLTVKLSVKDDIYYVNGIATYQSKEKNWNYPVSKSMYDSTNASNLNLEGNNEPTAKLLLKNMYVFYSNKGACKISFQNETTEDVDVNFYIINQADGLNSNSLQVIVDNNLGSAFFTNGGKPAIYHNFTAGMVYATTNCDMKKIDTLSKADKRLYDVKVDIFSDKDCTKKITTITGTALK